MTQAQRIPLAGCFAAMIGGIGGCVLIWWFLTHTNWKGIPPYQFTLLNDLAVGVMAARVEPTPGPILVLRPSARATFTQSDPMYEGVTLLPRVGRPLMLAVRDPADRPLGRLLLTEAFLAASRGVTICLSAAAEPPHIVDSLTDADNTCRKPRST